ncbi:MAG: DUF2085 domain-containing protein [bacterium]|jgi:uncharacterized membrane protein
MILEKIYNFLFFIFSGLCHQISERSFCDLNGHQFFVCSRDTGTYIGFLLSFIIIYIINKSFYKNNSFIDNLITNYIKPIIALFFFYLFLFGLDGITSYTNLRETTNYIRYSTGLFLASHLGLIFKYFELSINKAFNENNFNKYNQNINKKQFINFILIYNLLVLLFYFSSLFLFLPYLIYILPIAIFFYFYKIIKLITDLIYFQIADLDNKFIKLLPHIIFIVLTFLLLFFLFLVGYLKQFSIIEIYHKLK